MTRVIAFDVNETLLDLSALDGSFEEIFGTATLRPQWFSLMLQLSFVGGITGDYVDYTTAQRAALAMLASRQGMPLTDAAADRLVGGMTGLPAHPEVPAALERLRETSLRIVALTNSPPAVAEAQLTHAGIRPLFDQALSADAVRRLKPAREAYLSVADAYGVDPGEVRLVAAHSWDVSGALSAGCKAAFVARPGMVLSPLGAQPDIVGPDLTSVVDQIVAVDA
ncbi:MAG: haloacid dehalogenase type II [Streptosporangiales bacterium]|nr:haloacid dehalogenase type II [Streptosporangiales bacterium]